MSAARSQVLLWQSLIITLSDKLLYCHVPDTFDSPGAEQGVTT